MSKKPKNLRKAAILFASLDADNAQALLAQMSPAQAALLRQEIEQLEAIDPAEQEGVVEEFFRIGPLVPDKQPSGIELDGRLPKYLSLSSVHRELQEPREHARHGPPPFDFLDRASGVALAGLLEREHPQTIAVVISHLTSDRAADVLAALSSDLQIDVARRLVDLDETDPEILRDIEQGLEAWLCEQVRDTRRRAAGISALNNILGAASPDAKRHLLANLARHDRHLAGKLRVGPAQAISFNQLEQMDRASLSVVVRHAPSELVVLALAGAGDEFVERVLDLLPPATADVLRRATRELAPIRLADVEEAQAALAELASHLQASGQIVPRLPGKLSVAV